MDSSSKNQLLELLCSNSSEREASIADELNKFSSKNNSDVILECVDNLDGDTKLEILGYIDQLACDEIEYFETFLVTLLKNPDSFMRSEALDLIAKLDYFPVLDEIVLLADSDPSWLVKVSAIEALADLATPQDPKILDVIYKNLRDTSSAVRAYAAWSIGILGDDNSNFILSECINEEKSDDVQADILLSRFYLGEDACLSSFLELLEEAEDTSIIAYLNRLSELLERELNDRLRGNSVKAIKDSLLRFSEKSQSRNLSIEKLLVILETSQSIG